MRNGRLLIAALLLCSTASPSASQPAASEQSEVTARERAMKALEADLHPRSGDVAIPEAHVKLMLGDRFTFLPAPEARRVLNEAWGNPPEALTGVLGLVLPKGAHFYDETWGAVVQYEDTGHIDDKDAASEDYDKVLADLREGEEESNKTARAAGYAGGTTIGWAQAPTYDAATRTLIWARNIRFDGTSGNTLNYDVRTLSRTGTLSLNMVDSMSRIALVRAAAQDLGRTVTFDPGQQYADFDSKTDKLADYGLAGLVAGGVGLAVAKKAGFIGLLLLFLKKGFVVLLVALAGGWKWIKRKLGRDKEEESLAWESDVEAAEEIADSDTPDDKEPAIAPAAPAAPTA
jgi:uncharacterized membrane-anchored protein